MVASVVEQIRDRFSGTAATREIFNRLARHDDNLVIVGMRGGSSTVLLSLLSEESNRPILVLTSNLERAEALTDGTAFLGATPLLFPGFETLPFEEGEPALHIASSRNQALGELARYSPAKRPPLIIAPAEALMHRILPKTELRATALDIEWGQKLDIDELAAQLHEMGYSREAMVESPGEFSIRGTIVDVYPGEAESPWRLDFFGDEIESIRKFDPVTQRSMPLDREIERIHILARSNLMPAMEYAAAGGKLGSFFDLLPTNTLIFLDGPNRIDQRLEYFDGIARRHWEDIQKPHAGEKPNFFIEHGLQAEDWILRSEEPKNAIRKFQRISAVDLAAEADEAGRAASEPISIGAQSFESIPPNFKNFLDLMNEKRTFGYVIAVVCDNAGQVQRLDELLAEHQISAVVVDAADGTDGAGTRRARGAPMAASDVALLVGDLNEGFIFPAAKLLLLTDREIFGRYKKRRVYRKAYHGKQVKDPTEIQRGDFVVHVDHGIGQFEGIRRQPIEGRMTEFLEMTYQDGDRLLVPIDKLHLVQKYASAEGKAPALDKLGKKAWSKRRAKSQEMVRKLAGELLELYARREAAEGLSYGPDTVWQQEFESSFLYQETPDQMKAIRDVKEDLMKARPMDRLVCGDVGYGKTEVAIRAAFKALTEGHQVAVLVPTTLLAQQHYRTFTERLADYPFKVAVLSRFNSPAEQKETLADLAVGKVNLVIGTHRLISKDVKFLDLGLLVVDEEQRFGVAQKERIKSMRTSIHILTLTATPIPRTLHMALAKLRDLSIIQTPPVDRLPIKTRTIYFEKEQLEEAILRELNRGGQIFFVHNRIESIDDVANSVREIVPQAKIAVAHGQMDENVLEQIMIDFVGGKFDILISTTIIENGIDIPNVNTIIINRADAMGLAQLYQLRGRVGRDVRQAYAYLILPRGRAITDTAVKRLSALEEFTELGMGFSVAMRDMEIRGTGNILGAEQHGAITDIGFEMYCKLLEEAVLELRGDAPPEPTWPTEVKWPVDQWLPEEYVPVESQRIRLYKDLAAAQDLEQLDLIRDELLDRYGDLPREAKNLVSAFRAKIALSKWHVDQVRRGIDGSIRFASKDFASQIGKEIAKLLDGERWVKNVERKPDGGVVILIRDSKMGAETVLENFAGALNDLSVPIEEAATAVRVV